MEILRSWEDKERIDKVLDRFPIPFEEGIKREVSKIIQDVRRRGDDAIFDYTQRFDHIRPSKFQIEKEEIEEAFLKTESDIKEAMEAAKANIERFYSEGLPTSWKREFEDGVILGEYYRPIERVGVYVPGGKAPLFSSLLMACVVAKVAGVREIAVATPPTQEGINPYILAGAKVVGVEEVYCVGGVQAIAAFAFGTQSIPKVDKIVGPGNIYVMAAKAILYGVVGVDLLAGPSEVAILADEEANPHYITSELFAQAEHDQDASLLLITTSEDLANQVSEQIKEEMEGLERKEIIYSSISKSAIIISCSLEEGVSFVNRYGPEHLVILTREPWGVMEGVRNAGAVFVGENSPVACGDYIAGPSHILPTGGAARFSSGLGVLDFMKSISVISYKGEGLKKVSEAIMKMAKIEGLGAHARSIEVRL